ncbi:TPA: hypothetical protein N0F65_005097, partial [Lagenidium giganteum]
WHYSEQERAGISERLEGLVAVRVSTQGLPLLHGYGQSDTEQQAFAEDIQLLLFSEDLQMFNDIVYEHNAPSPNRVVVALRVLTSIHYPLGTRGLIVD